MRDLGYNEKGELKRTHVRKQDDESILVEEEKNGGGVHRPTKVTDSTLDSIDS
jgi:hypothetical protein